MLLVYSSTNPSGLFFCFYVSLSLPLSLYIYISNSWKKSAFATLVRKGANNDAKLQKNIYNCKNQLKIKEKIRQNRKFNCLVAVVMGFFYGMMRV